MCYVPDLEHVIGAPDETSLGLIEGADFVICDSTYTDDEFPGRMGWGHSTWQEGVRLCQAAGAKMLALSS
jgi:ribonuclease BN (tRNA processing enzyme)